MKRIHIIGGGLAGLTLGIALRRAGVPVTLTEAGEYPRHRVCGEFVSGRGMHLLRELVPLTDVATRMARDVAFFTAKRLGVRPLPEPALCVSRHLLDAALATEFQRAGGELRVRTRETVAGAPEAVVFATGRRAHPIDETGTRWVGLKMHARQVPLEADLEMHVGADAYIGLCRLAGGNVNICGLFRIPPGAGAATMDRLRGEPGTLLASKLSAASWDESSFCAVAGLCLRPQQIDASCCRVGDALTMIPPLTGNGMSMAVESALIAAGPLTEFARGRRSWNEATTSIASALQGAFASRLRWAAKLHGALFRQSAARALLPLVFRLPPAWNQAFALTRG